MTCAPHQLDAYIDGELAAADAAAVEEHLHTCAACSREALARMQLKHAVRSAAQAFAPSADFRARVAASIKPARTPMRLFRSPMLLGSLAAVLLIAVSIPLLARRYERSHATAELLDIHIATLASVNPVDVLSTDRHTVKPWFQGKLPFTFNLPELADSPYKLTGGRLIYFEHNPGAQLLFSLHQHRFSVFIVQDTGPAPASAQNENGFNVESWTAAGLRYTILSDAAPNDVHALAVLLRTAQ
ncbi:MAG TPA: zf-HC2 domain-containing protein [Terracidiphilus sp.]|jgi:anti-sigma factor RsiW